MGKINDWELARFFAIENMVSLDETISVDYQEDGISRIETIGDNESEKFLRLKIFLLTVCDTKQEEQVVELLCEEYDVKEIAKKLNVGYTRIKNIIYGVRDKCQKYGLRPNQRLKKKKK